MSNYIVAKEGTLIDPKNPALAAALAELPFTVDITASRKTLLQITTGLRRRREAENHDRKGRPPDQQKPPYQVCLPGMWRLRRTFLTSINSR